MAAGVIPVQAVEILIVAMKTVAITMTKTMLSAAVQMVMMGVATH